MLNSEITLNKLTNCILAFISHLTHIECFIIFEFHAFSFSHIKEFKSSHQVLKFVLLFVLKVKCSLSRNEMVST